MVEQLVEAILGLEDGYLVAVTGAGVSAASGIRTFRGSEPDAVWKEHDVRLATRHTFERDPVSQWKWYLERFRAVDTAEPNAAHRALAELERWHEGRGGRFLLVTQNIDTLHERAGSRSLVKVHGTADRLRCSHPGCANAAPAGSLPRADFDLAGFAEQPVLERLPRCPGCGSLLRAHVLLFDEYYQEHEDYRFDRVQEAAGAADLLLFGGTSFSVGVTDLVLETGLRRSIPVFSIDPASPPHPGVTSLKGGAEELLPLLIERLT